ncbi:hypothetical protein TNCV_1332011 [Trichonephila clavipes]|nr:hypothetical protein TNCV_1332011 [Trichonephila clavipes]
MGEKGRFQRRDGSGRPRATADIEDILTVKSAVTASDSSLSTIRPDCEPIVFSDESRFQLCHDDDRGSVWRSPGQRADPAFTIARHIDPQRSVIVWNAI